VSLKVRFVMGESGDFTKLLSRIRDDKEAAAQVLPLVYGELRRVAAGMMQRERPGHTLQPTAVVHEAYMRLIGGAHPTIENRAHFFAIAARAMRQVLVDHARRKLAGKRGGKIHPRVELEEDIALTVQQSEEVLAIHQALERLEELDPRQARIVEMHYFSGNPVDEIAGALGISDRTVTRELQSARLFLKQQLDGTGVKLP
jgi:RNA polymerase sigma factor (TIGR02999 family)